METYAAFVMNVLGLKRDQVSGLAECFSHDCPPPPSLPFLTPHCGRQEEGEGRADCCTEPNYQQIFLYCRSKEDVKKKKKNQPAAFAYSTHWRKMSAPVQIDHVIAARSKDHNTYTHTLNC